MKLLLNICANVLDILVKPVATAEGPASYYLPAASSELFTDSVHLLTLYRGYGNQVNSVALSALRFSPVL